MPDATHTVGPAVFLSYAREDAASVRRVAGALRCAGGGRLGDAAIVALPFAKPSEAMLADPRHDAPLD